VNLARHFNEIAENLFQLDQKSIVTRINVAMLNIHGTILNISVVSFRIAAT